MKIIGLLINLNALILTVWWVSTEHPHKPWAITACILALFVGMFMVLQDRAIEITLKGVGSIKAAAQQATTDANAIASLKERIEAQSATIDLVATKASEARNLVDQLAERAQEADAKIDQVDKTIKEAEKLNLFHSIVLAAENDDWDAFVSLLKWIDDKNFPLREIAANAYTRIRISFTGPIGRGFLNPTWQAGVNPEIIPLSALRTAYDKLNPIYHASVVKTVWGRDDIAKHDKMSFFIHVLNASKSMNAKNNAAKYFVKCAGDNAPNWEPFKIELLLQWWDEHKELIE